MRILSILLLSTLILAGCVWNPPTDDAEVARNFWLNHQPVVND